MFGQNYIIHPQKDSYESSKQYNKLKNDKSDEFESFLMDMDSSELFKSNGKIETQNDVQSSFEAIRSAALAGDVLAQWRLRRRLEKANKPNSTQRILPLSSFIQSNPILDVPPIHHSINPNLFPFQANCANAESRKSRTLPPTCRLDNSVYYPPETHVCVAKGHLNVNSCLLHCQDQSCQTVRINGTVSSVTVGTNTCPVRNPSMRSQGVATSSISHLNKSIQYCRTTFNFGMQFGTSCFNQQNNSIQCKLQPNELNTCLQIPALKTTVMQKDRSCSKSMMEKDSAPISESRCLPSSDCLQPYISRHQPTATTAISEASLPLTPCRASLDSFISPSTLSSPLSSMYTFKEYSNTFWQDAEIPPGDTEPACLNTTLDAFNHRPERNPVFDLCADVQSNLEFQLSNDPILQELLRAHDDCMLKISLVEEILSEKTKEGIVATLQKPHIFEDDGNERIVNRSKNN